MPDRNFLRAEAAYLSPPERPDLADIREAWYETIDPEFIARALMAGLAADGVIPYGWYKPMAYKLIPFFARNIGDELGVLGALLECNETYQKFEDNYFEADDEPDPDRGRDE